MNTITKDESLKFYGIDNIKVGPHEFYEGYIEVDTPKGKVTLTNDNDELKSNIYFAYPISEDVYPIMIDDTKLYVFRNNVGDWECMSEENFDPDMFTSIEQAKEFSKDYLEDEDSTWSDTLTEIFCKE